LTNESTRLQGPSAMRHQVVTALQSTRQFLPPCDDILVTSHCGALYTNLYILSDPAFGVGRTVLFLFSFSFFFFFPFFPQRQTPIQSRGLPGVVPMYVVSLGP